MTLKRKVIAIFSIMVLSAIITCLIMGPINVAIDSFRNITAEKTISLNILEIIFTISAYFCGLLVIVGTIGAKRKDTKQYEKYYKLITKLVYFCLVFTAIGLVGIIIPWINIKTNPIFAYYLIMILAIISLLYFLAGGIVFIRYIKTGK